MPDPLGQRERLMKFVGLTVAILMAGSATACFVMGKPELAVASGIVGGWSLTIALDVFKQELLDDLRRPEHEPEEETTSTGKAEG